MIRSPLRAALALCLAVTMLAAAAPPVQRALLTLRVNTIAKSEIIVELQGKNALVRRADLDAAGLHGFPYEQTAKASDWISLDSLAPTLAYRVDDTNLELDLTVTGDRFGDGTVIDVQRRERLALTPPARSAFLNYAVGGASGAGLLLAGEAGTRIGAGVLDGTWNFAARQTAGRNMLRWSVDEPATSKRVTAGDFYTDTGDLGGTVAFTGIGSQRYFGFNTGIVRSVLPGINGIVDSPSVASIYINGTLYRQEMLQPGQFNLQNLPVQNGAGNMQVVVTDAFGRRQSYTKSFYASDALLAPGVTDFSYGLGVLRPSFETAPVSGAGFAGRLAAGVTPDFTAGGRVEFAGRVLSVGPNVAIRLHEGVLGFAGAVSDDAGARGGAGLASYQFTSPRFSVAASLRWESPSYATLSAPASYDRPLTTANLSFGLPLGRDTSVGLSLIGQRFRDAGAQSELQLSQWRTLSQQATLQFTETMSSYNSSRHFGFATQINFIPRTNESASFGASSSDGRTGLTANFDRALAAQAPSLGYDAGVNASPGDASLFGQAQYRWRYGDYLADVNVGNGANDVSFNAAGGLVFIGGRFFASRPVADSYALVDTGVPGVRITANNIELGRTDKQGYLLVPQLESYFGNEISINPADAPVNTEIAASVQHVTPMAHSGAVVKFDLRSVSTITGTLRVRSSGAFAVPAFGIFELSLKGSTRVSDIGEQGEFFFENLPAGDYRGKIQYRGGTCLMTVRVPQSSTPFLKLGTLLCNQRTIR